MTYRCTECGHTQDHWSGRCENWENHTKDQAEWNVMEAVNEGN